LDFEVRSINFFVLFIIVEVLIHLCLLSLNHVKSNDFKSI